MLKVGFRSVVFFAVVAAAGCGHGTLIGSNPLPTATPNPTGVSSEFPNAGVEAAPADIALGSDGNLYITNFSANSINGFSVTADTFTRFLPKTANSEPLGITEGPDADIWFVEQAGNKVATLALSTITEYPLPPGAAPAYITSGPAASLYFTEPGLDAVGFISTTTHVASGPFLIPTPNSGPLGIAAAPDNTVWFTEHTAAKLGRFNPLASKVDEEVPLPAGSVNPTQICLGPDAALWFTENNPAGPKLGRLVPSTGAISEYPLPGAKSATALAVGLDNNFYFTDPVNNAIGQFNVTTLAVAEYKIPTPNSSPSSLQLGTDGKFYFTEQAANKIGQFTYF